MNRGFSLDQLKSIIYKRPATIRKLINPTPQLLAICLFSNYDIVKYLAPEVFTEKVLEEYLNLWVADYKKSVKANSLGRSLYPYYLKVFSADDLKKVPAKIVATMYKLSTGTIKYFPQTPYTLWLDYAKGVDVYGGNRTNPLKFEQIPKQHLTEDMLVTYVACEPRNRSIPTELWTDTIVDRILEQEPEAINHIPTSFVTYGRVTSAFNKKADIDLGAGIIPETLWDKTLAELVTKEGLNLQHVPKTLIDEAMCLRSAKFGIGLVFIPKKFYTTPVLAEVLFHGNNIWDDFPEEAFKSKMLIRALAKRDLDDLDLTKKIERSNKGIERYLSYGGETAKILLSTMWEEVLEINPSEIMNIPKIEQTDSIVKTYLSNAPGNVLTAMSDYVNLSRIKKEYTPLLIGSDSKVLMGLAERKLKGNEKRSPRIEQEKVELPVPTGDIQVDLTDGEYRDLLKSLPTLR